MNARLEQILEESRAIMSTVKDLQAASSLLAWDQETYMPEGAAMARAEQIATLDAMAHSELTKASTRETVERAREANPNDENRLLALFVKDCDRAVKLPESLVRETSKACALAHESWKKARSEKKYSLFRDDLHHLVKLKRQAADCLGHGGNPYDALLDLYEPGISVAQLRPVFQRLREGTVRILEAVSHATDKVSADVLFKRYETSRQVEFATAICKRLGFDVRHGRIDMSVHPFCTSFAQTDVRLTTRVFENDLRSCLFGLIHETGHGMYEQGMSPVLARTFASEGASMGIHESQSLFWENVVARSEEFWQWALPLMKDYFPEQLAGVSSFDMYKAINTVEPSLIRIESDEVTYNMHIVIRFEIEEALINGTMSVDDVPGIWNAKMQEYLGIQPTNDAEGCLQDIHWSFGGFGYFPSYTLGKLYAAMLRKALLRDVAHASESIRRGEFGEILSWLRDNIHVHGKLRTPDEIIRDISGESLSEQGFLEYVEAKTSRVYNLTFAK